MSVIRGLTGSVTLPSGATAKLNAVDVVSGQELADISSFGGNGWRERTTLLKDISGTASGFLTTDEPGWTTLSNTPATMTIVFQTGYQLTFDALLGQIQSTMRYDGVVVISYQYVNAGGIPTEDWTGS